MSGITGIFHFDGRPVNPEILKRMTDVASHRGPDGSGYWCAGPIGLGHRMFHTTPESLHERQPLTDDEFLLCLTSDGRIDNREDLKRSLASSDFRLRTDTDAKSCCKPTDAKEGCAQKLIGDFAFVILDERRRQLYCAEIART
jgi:asparagine synthase (glutamine-hydrolysing)